MKRGRSLAPSRKDEKFALASDVAIEYEPMVSSPSYVYFVRFVHKSTLVLKMQIFYLQFLPYAFILPHSLDDVPKDIGGLFIHTLERMTVNIARG